MMAEPMEVGIAGSVAGLAANAMERAQAIGDLIKGIRNAPRNLVRVGDELNDLQMVLAEAKSSPVLGSDGAATGALQDYLIELENIKVQVEALEQIANETSPCAATASSVHKRRDKNELKALLESIQRRKITTCMILLSSAAREHSRSGGPKRESKAKPTADQDIIARDAVEGTMAFKTILSDIVDKAVEKILEDKSNFDRCYLQQLDKSIAEEVWKSDLPHVGRLKQFVMTQRTRTENLMSICALDYEQDYSEIVEAVETCGWIAEDQTYQAWIAEASPQILHLVGGPGRGKTVLAKHIIKSVLDDHNTSSTHAKVLYYFCNNRKHAQETASSILRAMIHQLIVDTPSLVETFLGSCGSVGASPFSTTISDDGWSLQTLCKAFVDMASASNFKSIYCVIDALDENERDSVNELLQRLLKGLLGLANNGTMLKFIVTSRPEDYIVEQLANQPRIEISTQAVRKDIQTIVQKRFGSLEKRLTSNEREELELQEELVQRADGSFLWVTLVLGILEKARGINAETPLELVRGLPTGLNELYDAILLKIAADNEDTDACNLIRQVLTWVVLASRPLSLDELRIALAVRRDTSSLAQNEISNTMKAIDTICGAFVEIVPVPAPLEEEPANAVRLIHQFVKDYLLDPRLASKDKISKFRIDPSIGHVELSEQCLTYLLYDDFAGNQTQPGLHGPTPTDEDEEEDLYSISREMREKSPFIGYASLNWTYHVRQLSSPEGGSGEHIVRLACKFLRSSAHFQTSLRVSAHRRYASRRYWHGQPALHFAASNGLYHVVQELLKDPEIDVNTQDSLGESVLAAVSITAGQHLNDTIRIVELLIGQGARPSRCACHGRSPLHWAITSDGSLELCKVFLENGAALPAFDIDDDGMRSIHYAAAYDRADIIQLLLDRKINDINETTNRGKTALHLASENANVEVIQTLILRGADIDASTNEKNYTPLHLAVINNMDDIVKPLLEAGANPEARAAGSCNTCLHFAATKGHIYIMKLLIDHGADIGATTDILERTPLHLSVEKYHDDCAELLLDNGADIEAYDLGPMIATPLMYAFGFNSSRSLKTVKMLFRRGANVNAPYGEEGYHALHHAVGHGSSEIINLIISNISDMDPVDTHGTTPLHHAATFDDDDTARILIDAGASLDKQDSDGDSALILTARGGCKDTLELLLKSGADTDIVNNDGETALVCAADEGRINIVQALLEAGVKVNPEVLGEHMLAVAIASQDVEAIHTYMANTTPSDLVIRRYWNFLEKDDHHSNVTPPESRDAIITAAGKLPGLVSKRGSTLLHFACLVGYAGLVEKLIAAGMDVMAVDQNGWTPWHIAMYAEQSYTWDESLFLSCALKLEANTGKAALQAVVRPPQRLPSRWINAEPADSPNGFLLSEDGKTAELPEGENRNWDKSAGVVADSWVTFGAINAESRFYYEIEILEVGKLHVCDYGFSLEVTRVNRHLGADKYGWSYSVTHGMKRHDASWSQFGYQGHPKVVKGDVLGCGISISEHHFFFTKNGVHLGKAFFSGQCPRPLYPHLTALGGGFKFKVNFGEAPFVYALPQVDEGVDLSDEDSDSGNASD